MTAQHRYRLIDEDSDRKVRDLVRDSSDRSIFLNIFRSSPVPYCLFDSRGKIIRLNEAFVRLFGYDLEDVPTLTSWFEKAFPETDYRQWVESKFQQITERNTINLELEAFQVTIKCKNGNERVVLLNDVLLTKSISDIHFITLHDITEITEANKRNNDLVASLTEAKSALEQQNIELTEEKNKVLLKEERLRLALLGATDGLWDWDVENDFVYFSPRYKLMLGYQEHELEDSFDTWERLVHPEDVEEAKASIRNFLDGKTGRYESEFRMQHKDGHYLMILSRAFVADRDEGKIKRFVGTHLDITERKKAEEQLKYQSSHDSLTNLVNRGEFERRTRGVLSESILSEQQHALCYIDLDQFKIVNDTCGHSAGDELLRQLSSILQDTVRSGDTLARLGGDEFGVLMLNCNVEKALERCDEIQQAISDYQFIWDNRSFRIGASMGLVVIDQAAKDFNELLKLADAACYMAKDKGRNCIHIHTDEDKELARRQGEIEWVNRIHEAIDEDRFVLFAQEIQSLKQSEGKHYELLIRMLDEDGSIIPPGAFLPSAERYQIMRKLDRWVVLDALKTLKANPDKLDSFAMISINLSGQSLADQSFLDFMVAEIRDLGRHSTKICFEITETSAIANLAFATHFVKTLKGFGCSFALDDFGSGLSSFAYLKTLDVDYLKIDGVFVKDIVEDPIDHALVKSINDIGQLMQMRTVAEFVENEHIRDELSKIGVNYAQGYGIHKPEPFSSILDSIQ